MYSYTYIKVSILIYLYILKSKTSVNMRYLSLFSITIEHVCNKSILTGFEKSWLPQAHSQGGFGRFGKTALTKKGPMHVTVLRKHLHYYK